jgi:hypothetical protein
LTVDPQTDQEAIVNKRLSVMFLVLVVVTAIGSAQQLPLTASSVTLDGAIGDKEYTLTLPLGTMTVYLNRTADTLNMAVSAPTTGWVALGFGSEKMDGARLFLGTVKDGKASLSQERGARHSHKPLTDTLTMSFAMSEGKSSATLELAFKASDVIKPGQGALAILAAYGATDTITAYHTARDRVTIKLQ